MCDAALKWESATHLKVPDSKTRGAAEHVPTPVEDNISLDDVIAKFEAMDGITERAEEILAAAITLRDSSGRDRKQALRSMAATWNVSRYEKVTGNGKIVAFLCWRRTWKQQCAMPL